MSAIQFRKALANDEEDRPFITDPGQSNVPLFQQALLELAQKRKAEHIQRLQSVRDVFLERVWSVLRVIKAQWEDESRASDEAGRLREELSVFLEPLRKAFHVRQGEFRAFLKKTIPQRIADLVVGATSKARVEIFNYLCRLSEANVKTLQASVRRGGRFKGATDIDVPREFALRVEEPIAEAWTKQILSDIRKETKQYGTDCEKLVEKVVTWAKEKGARVKPKLVEAQYNSIKADTARLNSVGREMVNELREEAKSQLIDAIDPPIREGCRSFIDDSQNLGNGVRARILTLYTQLAEKVTKVVEKPASAILTRLFRDVEKEISAAFESHQDPLAAASDAIVSSQEDYLRRSDAQKRKNILEQVCGVLSSCPVKPAEGSNS